MTATGSWRIPQPLNLLTGWPREAADELDTALFEQKRAGRIILSHVERRQLAKRLQPGRYHVLITRPDDLAAFSAEQQRQIAAAVSLIVLTPLAPPPGDPHAWAPLERPLILLPPGSPARATAYLSALCDLLVEQQVMLLTAFHNAGLSCLPQGDTAALILPRSEEAIWPAAAGHAAAAAATDAPAAADPNPVLPGLVIGRAQIGNGALYVFKNSGDVIMDGGQQVKINRHSARGSSAEPPGGDIVYGDQLKIERGRRAP